MPRPPPRSHCLDGTAVPDPSDTDGGAAATLRAVAILVSALELTHAFGARALFQGVGFTLSDGDRVGLIGPNGAGKSTLLRMLAGELSPDGGEIARRTRLRVGYLPQVPDLPATSVRQAVHAGLPAADAAG